MNDQSKPRTLIFSRPALGWLAAGALGAVWLLGAASPTVVHIGVVDADRVRTASVSLQKELKAAAGPSETFQAQLKAKQAEITAAEAQYEAQKSTVTKEINDQRLTSIGTLVTEASAIGKKMDEALALATQTKLDPMRRRVLDAIAGEARDRGLEMILTNDRVLYCQPEADLTLAVIARLDAAPSPGPALPPLPTLTPMSVTPGGKR